jgi:hypothetical protein
MAMNPKRKAPAASEPTDVKLAADLVGLLHCQSRAAHLESLEDHLSTAASLSRALWELVRSYDFTADDERSVNAVVALASEVADHASAAEFIFNTNVEERRLSRGLAHEPSLTAFAFATAS